MTSCAGKLYNNLAGSHVVIHILCCLLGIASWVDLSGVLLEQPIMITTLPEQQTLSSILNVIVQMANVGPLIFGIFVCIFPKRSIEIPTTCIIILVGIVSCVLLSFFWDTTSYVGGVIHSTPLFVLCFTLAFVDSTSTLAFLAFMAMFKPAYLPAYLVGEGLSTFLPSLVALGQGSSKVQCVNMTFIVSQEIGGQVFNLSIDREIPVFDPPAISVQVFFLILAGFLCLSLTAFVCIISFPRWNVYSTAYTVSPYSKDRSEEDATELQDMKMYKAMNTFSIEKHSKTLSSTSRNNSDDHKELPDISFCQCALLLAQASWLMCMLGIYVSMQPYFSMPYGLNFYQLANTLSTMSLAAGSLFYFLVPLNSVIVVCILTVLHTGLAGYFVYMATTSPNPPLLYHDAGAPLLITLSILIVFMWTYSRATIIGILRPFGRRMMILVGVAIQLGSLVGGVTGYVIVNVYHVFKQAEPCSYRT